MSALSPFAPTVLIIVALILALTLFSRVLERRRIRRGSPRIGVQLFKAIYTFLAILVVILVMPLDPAVRGQLLGLLAIVIGASVVLSSGTIVGNALAGLMLRYSGHRVGLGQHVVVEGHSGRVVDLGVLYTQIENENREPIWLPNKWLLGQPLKLIQDSGSVVHAHVSLGYNVDRAAARKVLLEAARGAELAQPLVHITKLGDFTVTYRVAGSLSDGGRLPQTRSRLREEILDRLREANIEVASPALTTPLPIPEDKTLRPERMEIQELAATVSDRDIVFDEAEAVLELDKRRQALRGELKDASRRRDQAMDSKERASLAAEVKLLESELRKLGEDWWTWRSYS
jgi:small-conductance mechanosensitive channel